MNQMKSTIRISRKEVLDANLDSLKPFLNDLYWPRVNRRKKEHYRLLAYLSKQYRNAEFLDIGTRAGASAMCLAYNPSNKVYSVDLTNKNRFENNFDFSHFLNIQFTLWDATLMPPERYDDASLIFLDISHTGEPERAVLERIDQSQFKGILVMDDIDHHRFPEMRKLWAEIDRPKVVVPYAHDSGTGIVSYGPKVELVP